MGALSRQNGLPLTSPATAHGLCFTVFPPWGECAHSGFPTSFPSPYLRQHNEWWHFLNLNNILGFIKGLCELIYLVGGEVLYKKLRLWNRFRDFQSVSTTYLIKFLCSYLWNGDRIYFVALHEHLFVCWFAYLFILQVFKCQILFRKYSTEQDRPTSFLV